MVLLAVVVLGAIEVVVVTVVVVVPSVYAKSHGAVPSNSLS